jgi:hypothetical protein
VTQWLPQTGTYDPADLTQVGVSLHGAGQAVNTNDWKVMIAHAPDGLSFVPDPYLLGGFGEIARRVAR